MGFTNVYGVPGSVRSGAEAAVVDGRAVAQQLREETAAAVAQRVADGRPAPGLATILVGDDPASQVYVGAKHRACAEAGIRSVDRRLPADVEPAQLAETIHELNADPAVDGILLQLPLPGALDGGAFVELIDPRKDVDGLTVVNAGLLRQRRPGLAPCTPLGVMELLDRAQVELHGRHAVVVGRSDLVGRPLAAMLLARNATVTICHRYTQELERHTREADVLAVAVGVPGLIGAAHVKPGAVVIDVGINRVDGALVGDVDFDAVRPLASAITPVPGGVGPMTIACLLANTLRAAQLAETEADGRLAPLN